MRLIIFGAGGFIGSTLASCALASGFPVISYSRSRPAISGGEWRQWELGQEPKLPLRRGDIVAVHLAHDFGGEEGARLTFKGTVGCARFLAESGVDRQLFFSSYSAGPHSTSLYGQAKTAIEREIFSIPGVIIVRPGMVIGSGGIYGRIMEFARRFPFIPLPDGGKGMVPVIELEKLCAEVLAVATETHEGFQRELNVFEPELVSLRDMIAEPLLLEGRKLRVVNIPSRIIRIVLRSTEYFGLRLPVSLDSLDGFLANQKSSHISHYHRD